MLSCLGALTYAVLYKLLFHVRIVNARMSWDEERSHKARAFRTK